MEDWFDLAMPWWAFVVRGLLGYFGLLLLLRMAGRHSLGEMSAFDIVVLVMVGGALRPALLGGDKSVLGPFIAVTTIVAASAMLARLSSRFPRFNRWLEGPAVVLAKDGRILDEVLREHSIPRAALERELRLKDVHDVSTVRVARLEANGHISVRCK
ncbi:MAG: DUF421 domain-containing protein [Xanthomonadales bacterium]|nr:DUF421 domain-containing protein [Xanthomonadales bacterium]